MAQSEVIKILQKDKRKWFTTKELANELKQRKPLITRNLNAMLKYKEVKKKQISFKKGYLWRINY